MRKGAPHPTSPSPGRAGSPPGWGHQPPSLYFLLPTFPTLGPLAARFTSPQSKVMRLLLPLRNAVTLRDTDPSALRAGHYLGPQGRADLDVKPRSPARVSSRSLAHRLFLRKTRQSLGFTLKQGWKRAQKWEKFPPGSQAQTSSLQGGVVAWWGSRVLCPPSRLTPSTSTVAFSCPSQALRWLRQQHHLVPLLGLGKKFKGQSRSSLSRL